MGRLRIGCIGLGRMGRIFCGHLSGRPPGGDPAGGGRVPEATLAAVADVAPGLAERPAAEFAVPHWYADYNDLVTRAPVDAVIIATPASTHVDVVEAAAGAGLPPFLSKPLALPLAECDRAVAAVERAGVPCQIGFMRRFDRAYARAKRLIDEGAIGKPVTFKAVGRDPMMPRLAYARPPGGQRRADRGHGHSRLRPGALADGQRGAAGH